MNCMEAMDKLVMRDKEDCILRIQVYPSSKKEEILFASDSIIVRVTSPPRGGRANEDVVKLFKKKMKVKAKIESGFKSRDKMLRVYNVDCKDLAGKICGV
ncbi:MAG: DUF167 family protein [Desulfurococcales archaeon]|nr:DUF167 family protein [Desulfurococcales archaeon]